MKVKNTSLWRTLALAWDLMCDRPLPVQLQAANTDGKKNSSYLFNPLYVLPLWGAIWGVAALIAGKIFAAVLPVNGSALIFALMIMAAGEMRTTSRALALAVTFADLLFSSKSFTAAQTGRVDSLKTVNGLVPLLLAAGLLGGKFFCIYLAARTGHYGITSAAMVIALGGEAVLASDPAVSGLPRSCSNAKTEYIVALTGFLLLFNLITLPLATLVSAAVSAAIVILMLNLVLRRCGRIVSNDMTMLGYFLELAVWFIMAVLIG